MSFRITRIAPVTIGKNLTSFLRRDGSLCELVPVALLFWLVSPSNYCAKFPYYTYHFVAIVGSEELERAVTAFFCFLHTLQPTMPLSP